MATATAQTNNGNFLTHDPYDTWKQEIQQYQETKTGFKGKPDPYVKKTHADIKAKETIYNPIIQKFNDPDIES